MATLFLLLFFLPFGNAHGVERSNILSSQPDQLEALDLCTLDAQIEEYNEQHVLVSAFINGTVLYDPKCPIPMISVVFKPEMTGKLEALWKVEKRGHGDAFVIVEGIVHGPKPYLIDPKLPESIKNALKNKVIGYGHMGNCKMEIEVERILDVKSIKSTKGRETH